MKLRPAAVVQFGFTSGDVRRFAGDLLRNNKVPVFNFRRQAFHLRAQAELIGFRFADVRGKARIIKVQQRRPGVNDLPFMNVQLGDDSAFEVLNFLQL